MSVAKLSEFPEIKRVYDILSHSFWYPKIRNRQGKWYITVTNEKSISLDHAYRIIRKEFPRRLYMTSGGSYTMIFRVLTDSEVDSGKYDGFFY